MNSTAHGFGMTTNDFYSFLNNDLEEAENIQLARLAEEEKAMFAVSVNCFINVKIKKFMVKTKNSLQNNWLNLILKDHFWAKKKV